MIKEDKNKENFLLSLAAEMGLITFVKCETDMETESEMEELRTKQENLKQKNNLSKLT